MISSALNLSTIFTTHAHVVQCTPRLVARKVAIQRHPPFSNIIRQAFLLSQSRDFTPAYALTRCSDPRDISPPHNTMCLRLDHKITAQKQSNQDESADSANIHLRHLRVSDYWVGWKRQLQPDDLDRRACIFRGTRGFDIEW
jgi:hypothetical protein